MERAHRLKQAKFLEIQAIITKFFGWDLTENIKDRFIKIKSSIYVFQIYSPVLTKWRNNMMIARKELTRLDPPIQVFVKYPTKLMVKKAGEKEYKVHDEF